MDLQEVARMEEFRLARANEELAEEFLRVGGGIAGRGTPGSWLNNAVGIGLNGPVPRVEFEGMIRWYEEAGIETRMEVCPYVDPQFLKECEDLSFRVRAFETMFYRRLDRDEVVRPLHTQPPGLTIDPLDPGDERTVREAALVALTGFLPPGQIIIENDIADFKRGIVHPCTTTLLARLEGKLVGVGACEIRGEVSAIFGMSTLEGHRRQGIQQALLAARLNLAAQRSARIATIGSRPGVATERNVMRMGFTVAYTKVVLVKPGEGLVPMRY
jgi:GNAT superfamily N-acetyltransferase